MQTIIHTLNKYNIPVEVLDHYKEPHRYYHNINHIKTMINNIENPEYKTQDEFYKLVLAIIFHDIIYDPYECNNEEQSVELLKQYIGFHNDYPEIAEAILSTKSHKPNNNLSVELNKLDLQILYGNIGNFIQYDRQIFKEYQYVEYSYYKEKRSQILRSLDVNPLYIEVSQSYQPNIAIYAGSFNPFHIGHLNILKKAEQIFDKVIIARGKNLDKNNNDIKPLPECLKYHQVIEYDTLLTDLINSFNYDVTLVRGLRNSTDLQYEMNTYNFLKELKPNIKIISLFSDNEYNHISSSAIKNLEKYNKHKPYLC